ncbi:hypothetical protein [Nakamurella aerolata]|uniref:Uncharacterized protein n=1 Tax=Nakamurella aerolata TaxID=1656892 RepID=A0A849AGC5_9ACTN|nr:hypothetical protein [Nakamurella aerolata]NNG37500.1 hypothetical protein [Nakamurella aerolata]
MGLLRRWFSANSVVPQQVRDELGPEEVVHAHARSTDGVQLTVTRLRLLILRPDVSGGAERSAEPAAGETAVGAGLSALPWHRIAKARLQPRQLTVIPLRELTFGSDQSGADTGWDGELTVDAAPLTFALERPVKVTDQIHARVRRSVAASRYLPWHGGGGWVSLRRVAGRDGLLPQLRLDTGADPAAPGLLVAAKRVAAQLRQVDDQGVIGVD